MPNNPEDVLFEPIGVGGVPIGGGKFVLKKSGRRGIRFRLEGHPQQGDQEFLFQPIGGGPVVLGGAGRSRGRPTKITLTGHFVPADEDDGED